MIFELQATMLRSWMQLAETTTKAMVSSATELNRNAASAWGEVLRPIAAPAPFPMLPWLQPQLPFSGMPWMLNPLPMTTSWGWPASPFQFMAGAGWPSPLPFSQVWTSAFSGPPSAPQVFSEMLSASYRTAGGHAAAAVITGPLMKSMTDPEWWLPIRNGAKLH